MNYYITTPIYYVNDNPHIGHVYTSLACDVVARIKRLSGIEVKFLTGTDEHGQKVEKSAIDKEIDVQEFVDGISNKFRNLIELMNFSCSDFIRTTENRHKIAVTNFWNILKDKGFIYKGYYEGWYSYRDEAFYSELELVGGKAPTGATVEWLKEESYFFKLSAMQDKLLDLYENNRDFIFPDSRRNEVISFVKSGLQDLSISRTTCKWGIKVPDDDDHVMYVWLDALTNYLSAVGFPDTDNEDYQKFWNNSIDSPIHVVGKDILRFHAVYWPAFLMAADLPLPKKIIAHGWWTNEGEKISKSLGNVIDPHDIVAKYGVDNIRYFLLRGVSFGSDGDFSSDVLKTVINSELSNTIGNLSRRVIKFICKNFNGDLSSIDSLNETDKELINKGYQLKDIVYNSVINFEFHVAIDAIIKLGYSANKYIDDNAPWSLFKKGDIKRTKCVLYTLLEIIRCLGIILQPFIPESSSKLLDSINIDNEHRKLQHMSHEFALSDNNMIEDKGIIFPRLD